MARSLLPWVSLCAAALLWGCSPGPQPFEEVALDTEEVGLGIDAELSTEDDEKGALLTRSGGVVPGSFPEDLPLPREFTVVDFGTGGEAAYGDAGRHLVLRSPSPVAEVREHLVASLTAHGWAVGTTEAELSATQGGRSVTWLLSDARPGTRIEIRY